MATSNQLGRLEGSRQNASTATVAYPPGSINFDRVMAGVSLWLVAGLFLDGWAHNSLGDLETFFTPWHAVLYSGLGAAALSLGVAWIRNLRQGYRWDHALPHEYTLALLGVLIFGVAGGLDFTWHSIFGFEVDTEALLSPPHLLLATGGLFIISSPLRAVWRRSADGRAAWRSHWPAMASAFASLALFTFFTQFSNGFQHANSFTGHGPTEDAYFWQVTTISYLLIPTVVVVSFILLLIRHWTLPSGSIVLLITGNALLMWAMGSSYSGEQWPVLMAALAGGVIAEVMYRVLKPSYENIWQHRIFAFVTPFILNLIFLGSLIVTSGIWWRIHMWLGAPLLAAAIGLGLSYLAVPPRNTYTVENSAK